MGQKRRNKLKTSTPSVAVMDRDMMDMDVDENDQLEGTNFAQSPTPPEWSEDSDREWPYHGIVDHFVDMEGTTWYKVAWERWKRPDGSNTTWVREKTDIDRNAELAYKKANQMARKDGSKLEGNIPSSDILRFPPSNILTTLSRLAPPYHEGESSKLEEQFKKDIKNANTLHRNAERKWGTDVYSIEPINQSESDGDVEPRSPSVSLSRVFQADSGLPGSPSAPSAPSAPPSPPFIDFENDQQSRSDSSPNSLFHQDEQEEEERRQEELTSIMNGAYRENLQEQWDHAISSTGAARVTIVCSDPDDEGRCPRLPQDFQYLESDFEYDREIPQPDSEDADPALGCFCRPTCNAIPGLNVTCGCQARSRFSEPQFAYDKKGFFRFNNVDEEAHNANAIVYECTECCSCGSTCPNRTSQRPRTIPIEIYETQQCGWGVRCPDRLPKGTVLGFFTGKIITREKAARLEQYRRQEYIDRQEYLAQERERQSSEDSGRSKRRGREFREDEEDPEFMDRRDYIFDIDAEELRDDDEDTATHAPMQKYSVDAWASGNWTRFINHSCDPNAKVYTAMVHPPSQDSLPGRIVFVTIKDVPPGRELTIDYNPTFEGAGRGAARKSKPLAPGLLDVRRRRTAMTPPKPGPPSKNWDKRCKCETSYCRKVIYGPHIT
ncbi:hypothetical protein FRC02_000198 [Tulasnella sp. 418]|nr:hypothetical protein FRC02_000198 [Tulasnella sp. 418]